MAQSHEVNPAYITLVLAGLSAFLAWASSSHLLNSERPVFKEGESAKPMIQGHQNRLARLWQDPLSVEKIKNPPPTLTKELSDNISQKLNDEKTDITIISIFVEGSPYPEDVETRLRMRYAVVHGLLDSGLIPEDRSNLGLLKFELQTSHDPAPVCAYSTFEWYISPTKMFPSILVLWLREEPFSDFPLERLHQLSISLVKDQNFTNGRVHFVAVGPRSSDTLKNCADDHTVISGYGPWLKNFSLISPSATVPDALLYNENDSKVFIGPNREYVNSKINPTHEMHEFTNFIATDSHLGTNLVGELALRSIEPGSGSKDHIVLISEADTYYGRSLPTCLAAAWETHGQKLSNAQWGSILRKCAAGNYAPNLHPFKYIRGLDGASAPSDKASPSQKSTSAENPPGKESQTKPGQERSEGDAQLDYCRRLAEDIRQQLSTHQPRAIGVFGSDFYDKRLLFQALRPLFPNAQLFTTDLDARYLDKDPREATRNVLVASAYGLKVETNVLLRRAQ